MKHWWLIAGSVWIGVVVVGSLGLAATIGRLQSITPYDFWLEAAIASPMMGFLGAIILTHRSRNSIGLILFIGGLAFATVFGAGEYAVLAAEMGWPLGATAGWFANLVRAPQFVFGFSLLLLLYPSGRPLGRFGVLLILLVSIGTAAEAIHLAFTPGPLDDMRIYANPYGIESLRPVFPTLEAVGWVGAYVGIVGGIVTLAVRFIRSRGIERLQIKWVPFAAGAAFVLLLGLGLALPEAMEGELGSVMWTVAPLGVPAAMALAIVRYRLYEIDRIISRTVTYGLVSAVLVGVYLGAVFVLGNLLPSQGELAVAGSTLLAAALFNPLRKRVQGLVDRRFNRSRFDIERTMEALSRRLSSEVDLAELGRELQQVASQTMQPTTVSVWLREAG